MTKFYFHATTNGAAGLPTNEQSSLTVDNNGDAVTVNRKMDTTIGSSQTNRNCSTNASSSAQVSRFSRFVSPVLSVTSITAQTWNYAFAVSEDNVNANFPCSSTGKDIWVNVFVWNTNTQTKVGNIIDGVTSTGSFDEPSTAAQETSVYGQFGGSAVNSIPSGSVIVYEAIFQITQNNSTARTLTFHYDGANENNANGNTVSNHASYIETPQTVTFGGGNVVKTLTNTVTISSTVAKSKAKKPILAAQTVLISSTPNRLANKKRTLVAETVSIDTDPGSPSFIKAKNIAKAVPSDTITIASTVAFQRIRYRPIAQTVTINSTVDYLQHPKKFRAFLFETVILDTIAKRKSAKKRAILN